MHTRALESNSSILRTSAYRQSLPKRESETRSTIQRFRHVSATPSYSSTERREKGRRCLKMWWVVKVMAVADEKGNVMATAFSVEYDSFVICHTMGYVQIEFWSTNVRTIFSQCWYSCGCLLLILLHHGTHFQAKSATTLYVCALVRRLGIISKISRQGRDWHQLLQYEKWRVPSPVYTGFGLRNLSSKCGCVFGDSPKIPLLGESRVYTTSFPPMPFSTLFAPLRFFSARSFPCNLIFKQCISVPSSLQLLQTKLHYSVHTMRHFLSWKFTIFFPIMIWVE